MKPKIIRIILKKKFNKWLESIEDEALRERVRNNTVITGGCIASYLLNEKVNDYDIYFRDLDTTVQVVNYYIKKFAESNSMRSKYGDIILRRVVNNGRVKVFAKSVGVVSEDMNNEYQFFEQLDPTNTETTEFIDQATEILKDVRHGKEKKDAYRPIFMSSNAITLSNDIQLIIRFYGTPDEIHENFDFVHCMNYWTSWDDELVLRKDALLSLLTKQLDYRGSLYPICSVIRTRKYQSRGWHCNAGQYLKMCMQISELDLTDIKVLEDQLMGVDVAYFFELIQKLKAVKSDEADSTYVAQLIDEIF